MIFYIFPKLSRIDYLKDKIELKVNNFKINFHLVKYL